MSLNLPYNMNRDEKLVIDTNKMEWVDSPSAQVKRKPLEREKEESGQVTSVVEYKPGAKFKKHSHPMGEEIFVLSGEFADENGCYPRGTYIRNPPGSAHSPYSDKGCVLFVKLNQFLPEDKELVVLESEEQEWLQGQGGLKVKPLHSFEGRGAALVLWPKGEHFKPHRHWGGEEIFVISGTFQDEHDDYPAGTWIRSPHLSDHNPFSKEGCLILVKTGHM